LKTLTRRVLGVRLDKRQQMSDWGSRPLSAAQVEYAAADARVLVSLFDQLLLAEALSPQPVSARASAAEARSDGLLRALRPGSGGSNIPPVGFGKHGESRTALSSFPLHLEALLSRLALPLEGAKGRDAAFVAQPGWSGPAAKPGARGGSARCANATLLFMNAEPVGGVRSSPNAFWRRAADGALLMAWFEQESHTRTALAAAPALILYARLPREAYVCLGRCQVEVGAAEGEAHELPAALRSHAATPQMMRLRLLDAAGLVGSAHVAELLAHSQGEAGLSLLQ